MFVFLSKTIYERGNKKYIDVRVNPQDREYIENLHKLHYKKRDTPFFENLDDNILTVKVPWRYNKFDYIHKGLDTLYDLSEGSQLEVTLLFKGMWDTKTAHGFSWVLQKANTSLIRGKLFH